MIVGISGKLGSGKDLVGKIIQCLTNKPQCFDGMDVITEEDVNYKVWDQPKFVNKKFADTLKDFICMLLGCTRERLEDRDFKEGVLPKIWWYYKLGDGTILPRGYYPNEADNKMCEERYLVKTTPRLLLQLMGTECGRNILHPNVWVNAVMSNYKSIIGYAEGHYSNTCGKCDKDFLGDKRAVRCEDCGTIEPNWVITDMRFPNELAAVKERGFTIKVNRPKYENQGQEFYAEEDGKHVWFDNKELGNVGFMNLNNSKEHALEMFRKMVNEGQHASETSLDHAEFNYTIINNGTIKDLVDKIREILIKENLI